MYRPTRNGANSVPLTRLACCCIVCWGRLLRIAPILLYTVGTATNATHTHTNKKKL